MYGLRGCAPCVSCMGLGFIKGIKIFESMLKNQNLSSLLTKQLKVGFNINEIDLYY